MLSVFVIDDDSDLRQYIEVLLTSIKVPVVSYQSAVEFLNDFDSKKSGCILSDVFMPDMDGLTFQNELLVRNIQLPLVLMSSHGSISMVKSILKKGAVDFIEKPLDPKELLEVIQHALSLVGAGDQISEADSQFKDDLKLLSERESQILGLLVQGKDNATIANEQNISKRTVETHRSRILSKLKCHSLHEVIVNYFKFSVD